MSVHNPQRAIVGLCPDDGQVIVLLNDFEVWDLASCRCGWKGGTDELAKRVRYERDHISGVSDRTDLLLPPDHPVES